MDNVKSIIKSRLEILTKITKGVYDKREVEQMSDEQEMTPEQYEREANADHFSEEQFPNA